MALLGVLLIHAISMAAPSGDEEVIREIKALQTAFMADLNRGDHARVMAAYDESYEGLITEKGPMTLEMRSAQFAAGFASDDRATVTVLESHVRRLGRDHALLHSHIKVNYQKSPAKDWWYSAIYLRFGKGWKVIHEQ